MNESSISRNEAELERLEAAAVLRARHRALTAAEMENHAREFCMVFGFEFYSVSINGWLDLVVKDGVRTPELDPVVWLIILERARAMCSVGT